MWKNLINYALYTGNQGKLQVEYYCIWVWILQIVEQEIRSNVEFYSVPSVHFAYKELESTVFSNLAMILRYTWSSRDSSFHSKVKEAIDSSPSTKKV